MDFSYFQKNISLAPLTTFKIGGPADYFFVAKSEKDLIDALSFARQKKLAVFILGGGSNILVSDKGFRGLVIQIQNLKFKVKDCQIESQSGTALAELVGAAAKAGFTGIEWAAGIPGTLGGAIRGNAGAFGMDMSSIVKHIRVYSGGSIKQYQYNCHSEGGRPRAAHSFSGGARPTEESQDIFWYRDSIFKYNKEIILSADLELQKGEPEKIRQTIKNYLEQRRSKQPWEPSAGSVFKNIQFDKLSKKLQDIIPTEKIKAGKVAVAYFTELAGLKGHQIGQAQISPKHNNFIVNLGGAKASDVLSLINLIKQEIKNKFGIELEEEIQLVGF